MLKVVGASWTQIQISTWIIGVVIAIGIIAIIVTETNTDNDDGNYSATAYWDKETGFTIDFWGQGNKLSSIPRGVARAHYDPHLLQTGWAIFQVETQAEYDDRVQAYAAGLLEGSLTWQLIYWQWKNTVESYCDEERELCSSIRHYIKTNMDWMRNTAEENLNDPYWHQISLFITQLKGIEDGFNLGVKRSPLEIEEEIYSTDFFLMNIFGDISDLEEKLTSHANVWKKHKSRSFGANQGKDTDGKFDCGYKGIPMSSAFVKFLPEKESLFFAHNTAGQYTHMLKMFKRYEMRYHTNGSFNSPLVAGTDISFSSYPGAITSMDDFYVINGQSGHKLSIAGTQLSVFNKDLWQFSSPRNQVLLGPRAITACRLAKNSKDWVQTFSEHNSGTGNKAWFVLDVGLFEKATQDRKNPQRYSAEKLKNMFWLLEQIPGSIASVDQTEKLLNSTYWATYGLPYDQEISKKTGTQDMEIQHGTAFSFEHTALANIFRRDHVNATSIQTTLNLMKSNMYKIDPLSEGNPRCAVGSRGDVRGVIEDGPAEPVGVTDTKVFRSSAPLAPFVPVRNHTLRMELRVPQLLISAGPVFAGTSTMEDVDDLAPFAWSESSFHNLSHIGQPDKWMFEPLSIPFI